MLTDSDLKKRIGKITSSTAAACLGLDPMKSQIDAWLQIRGEDPAPQKEEVQPSKLLQKAIQRGNKLEPYILEYGAEYVSEHEDTDIVMTRAPFRSKEPWLGDSCDALYWPDNGHVDPANPWGDLIAIGEGKSASMMVGQQYGEEGTDDIPHHTLIQSHIHLIHWPEVDYCVIPALVGGHRFEFRCYIVERNKEFEEIILTDLHDWHRTHIQGDRVPEAICKDESWLMRRYPEALNGLMPMDDELQKLCFEKWKATKKKGEYDKRACAYQSKIRQHLGDFERSESWWGYVSWKNRDSFFETDWQSVANDAMDQSRMADDQRIKLIKKHTKEKLGPRVLRVQVKKEHHETVQKGTENNERTENGNDLAVGILVGEQK